MDISRRELLTIPAAAALAGYRGIPDYVIDVLTKHTEELERKGSLPKSK